MKKFFQFVKNEFYDEKLSTNRKQYILQSLLIFVCISIILMLYRFFGGIVVASLGASSFIVLITPHTKKANFRYVIGGYICGGITGIGFGFLHSTLLGMSLPGADNFLIILAAAAAAVATFIMVVMNLEHPPAAALALGLTVEPAFLRTALAALVGVLVVCAIRKLLRKHLIDLI